MLYGKVTQLYIYILFHFLFHYGLSQDIEYSFLCYTIGPCCLEENTGKTFSDIKHTTVFLGQSPKAIEIKAKNKQMGPNKTYKLLHSKGNHKQNEKTTYRRGENICK